MSAIAARSDIPAGLAVAGLLIPEAIAYAAIAGLAPVHALVAAIIGMTVYAFAGQSRFAIVAPTSSSAAVLAAGLATMAPGDAATRAAMAMAVVGMAGLIFVLAGVLRLGMLATFVSRPVLRGFAFGLAVSIVIRQLPLIAGVSVDATNPLLRLAGLIGAAGRWNLADVTIGLAAIAGLFGLKRWASIPAAFFVLALGIAISFAIDLPGHGVALVGPVSLTLERPTLPHFSQGEWLRLGNIALPLALIVFVESWGTARTLALRHGDMIEPSRELRALGIANLLSGVSGGLPVGAGFSASSANEAAGSTSRVSGAMAAFALTALALLVGPLIARIPEPALAAVVIAALAHALDPRPILRLWRIDRDQIIASAAAIGVLLFGVLNGMLIAVALSVIALVRRLATPEIATLGQLGASHNYVDVARHPEARIEPGILIVRPGEPMFFANAERILSTVEQQAARSNAHFLVLSLEESGDLDSTALDALAESAARLAASGRTLTLARMKDPVHDLLIVAGGPLEALAKRGTRSVADAVDQIAQMKETMK